MGNLEEALRLELLQAVKLDRKRRGELAEMAFMRKASALGFAVAKPWGESDRYDVVLRSGRVFWRVQIKSVWTASPGRHHYRVATTAGLDKKHRYTVDDIDFLVAYIFAEDTWYVFPVEIVANRGSVCVVPQSRKSPLDQYREAWKLMGLISADDTPVESAAKAAAAT